MTESPDHISCQELVELATGYLERALPAAETALFEQHLNFCEGCVWYVEQLRGTIAAAGGIAEDDITADDRDRLLSAFRGWSPS
jgi:putative zinc finger protein